MNNILFFIFINRYNFTTLYIFVLLNVKKIIEIVVF